MNVNAVGHDSIAQPVSKLNEKAVKVTAETTDTVSMACPARCDARIPSERSEDVQPIAPHEPGGNDDKPRGVIRLLEAGHFKGVADLRLRINFFDELSERAAAAAGPTLTEKSADLVTTMTDKVDDVVVALGVDEQTQASIQGLVDEFGSAVQDAVDQGLPSGTVGPDALVDPFQSAFDALVENLTALLSPVDDVEEPALEVADAVRIDPKRPGGDVIDNPRESLEEPAEEPAMTVDEAIALLTGAFQEALTELFNSISEAMQLPDPSPPTGRGVAYDKFLAIYNQLRGNASAVDERA